MSTLLENLNQEQLQAVTHPSGALLIVAGAGTGKTTVISRRIAYLVQQKLSRPEDILALTFTEKAAGEMEDRTLQLMPVGNYDLWISTFHSFCERILKQHGLDIGLPNDFKLANDTAQWILIYKNFEKFNLKYYKPLATPHKFINALQSHFSKCKDEMITPEAYLSYAKSLDNSEELLLNSNEVDEKERVTELAKAFAVYQQLLLENESLDFGDLINYTLKLFKQRPNVLKFYQAKFKYILVDEFQDTNFAQYELVKLLTGNKEQNLTVVGDDDQSIYKFRGASVSNILNFKKDFPELTQITLTNNYRSSQEILDLAYKFIQHNNPDRLEVDLNINKKLIGHNPNKGEISVIEQPDLSGELTAVVKRILNIKQENTELSWNDFAVLIRSNSAADEIIPRLEVAGIAYTFLANSGLYKKPFISLLIDYLKLLSNYHESASLYRVFSLPKFYLEPEELAKITHFAHKKTLSVYESLRNEELLNQLTEKSHAIVKNLLQIMSDHSENAGKQSTSELLAYVIKDLGIPEYLEKESLENAQTREFLDQFYKSVIEFEQGGQDKSLREYLKQLELEITAGNEGEIKFDPDAGPESLKVMTIHSSKGLEFENVFLINLVDQRFPTRAKKDAIEIPAALIKDILPEGDFHLQEERRLFYVAITRAKRRVFFSWAKDYGGARTKKPSIFLEECGLLPAPSLSKATGKVIFDKPKTLSLKEVYKEFPTKYSFTDISTFLKCPLEYKYKCYLKLPLPGAPQLSFGVTIHKVFQQYFEDYIRKQGNQQLELLPRPKKIQFPPFEKLKELYEKNWVDEWYFSKKQKTEYWERGKEMLKTFYDNTLQKKANPKYLEKFFLLKIGSFEFVGKIDRADSSKKGLEILDYKTGKVPKTKSESDFDQLHIYQLAAQESLMEQVSSLSYWYLEENVILSQTLASPEELESLKEKLLRVILEINDTIKYDLFAEKHKKSKTHNCSFDAYL